MKISVLAGFFEKIVKAFDQAFPQNRNRINMEEGYVAGIIVVDIDSNSGVSVEFEYGGFRRGCDLVAEKTFKQAYHHGNM